MVRTKEAAYAELVAQRKACTRCVASGLTNPCAAPGDYDSEQVGPWSTWNGSLDADVMVVGQEWGDVASFVRQKGRDNPSATNTTLKGLLSGVDVEVADAPIFSPVGRVFLTNAVLCLKQGGAQAPVSKEWFKNCQGFLRRQIELVRPRVVVTLGEQAYLSIRREFAFGRISFRRAVREYEFLKLLDGVFLVPMYHCGNRILNTHRPLEEQRTDWERVKRLLARVARNPRQETTLNYESIDFDLDRWAPDWTYETDLVLAHKSGLKVCFCDPANPLENPSGDRMKALGDFVPGTVQAADETMGVGMADGTTTVTEFRAASEMRLYSQARQLFRLRPPGTCRAPQRAAYCDSIPDDAQRDL